MGQKSRSLSNITLIYAMGNMASKMISFVLVFFTTYYLTKKELGFYDIILTTVSLISPFINWQLTDAVLRWLLENSDEENTSKVFTNIFCILVANSLVFLLVYWGIICFFPIEDKILIFLLLLTQSISPVTQIFARGNGKNVLFAVSGVLYTIIYTILTLLFLVVYGLKVQALFIANISANLGLTIFVLVKGKYYGCFDRKKIDFALCKKLILFSLPLIPNSLGWWLYSSANRYIVLFFLGLESSGVWAISYKIPTILTLFHSLFFLAWQEKSIREYNSPNRDKYFNDVLNKYVPLALGIVISLVAASKPLLGFIVEKSFFEAWKFAPFLLLATFFQSMALFYGVGYLCAKETKKVLATTLIGGFSTLTSSVILVPFFGLYGAGLGVVIGFFVMFIVRWKQTKKYFAIKFPLEKTIYMMAAIGVCWTLSYSDSISIQIVNNLIALSIAIFANKELIGDKINMLNHLYHEKRHVG
jgi:O-antigen/teichoic acid export membrane protein